MASEQSQGINVDDRQFSQQSQGKTVLVLVTNKTDESILVGVAPDRFCGFCRQEFEIKGQQQALFSHAERFELRLNNMRENNIRNDCIVNIDNEEFLQVNKAMELEIKKDKVQQSTTKDHD